MLMWFVAHERTYKPFWKSLTFVHALSSYIIQLRYNRQYILTVIFPALEALILQTCFFFDNI